MPPGGPEKPAAAPAGDKPSPTTLTCEACGDALLPVTFRNGESWSVEDLARVGKRKFGKVLDMGCYRKVNAERQAKQADAAAPF
jgi:hypothetical protein